MRRAKCQSGHVGLHAWRRGIHPTGFRNMLAAVDMAAVTGVFYTEIQWGIPRNHSRKHGHDWDHFVLPDPKFVSRDRPKTPHELRMLAQKLMTCWGAVVEFSPEVINTAITLLRSDSRARQERFKPLQDFQQASRYCAQVHAT